MYILHLFYYNLDKEGWKFVAMIHLLDLFISTADKMTITGPLFLFQRERNLAVQIYFMNFKFLINP